MLHRLLTVVVAVAIFIAALAFSVVVFALIAAAGVTALALAWARGKFGKPRSVGAARGSVVVIDLPSREVERVDEIAHR